MGLKSKFKKVTKAISNVVTNNPISSAVEAVTDNKYLGWVAKPAEWMVIPGALQYDVYCLFKDENKSIMHQNFSEEPVIQKLDFDLVTPKLYPPFKDWVLKQGDAPLRLTHTPRFRELDHIKFQVIGNYRYLLNSCNRADAKNLGYIEGWSDSFPIMVKARFDMKLVGWHFWDNQKWKWFPCIDYTTEASITKSDGSTVPVEAIAPWASSYSILPTLGNTEDWRFQMLYFIGPESEFEKSGRFTKSLDPEMRPTALFKITIPSYKDMSKGKVFSSKKFK